MDNLLLAGAGRITVLAGGCACCTELPALLSALRAICDAASGRQAGQISRILLETSGLADPGRIAASIADDSILTCRLAVEQTLVLVDSVHGYLQLATEPLARAQIEAADELILTKPLLADPATLGRFVLTLRQMNPAAALSAAESGVPVPLLLEDGLVPSTCPRLAPAGRSCPTGLSSAVTADGWGCLPGFPPCSRPGATT